MRVIFHIISREQDSKRINLGGLESNYDPSPPQRCSPPLATMSLPSIITIATNYIANMFEINK